jgi:hypothetical protein
MVASNNRMVHDFGPDQAKLLALGGGTTLGVANPVIALGVLALITGYLFRWTQWGRHVFAIGGNEQAARLTGVRVNRIKVGVYMVSALTAGITAVLEVGWLGAVTTNLGQSMELAVIAAAVIGGANLSGGSGTAFGAVIGAALIEVIRTVCCCWVSMHSGKACSLAASSCSRSCSTSSKARSPNSRQRSSSCSPCGLALWTANCRRRGTPHRTDKTHNEPPAVSRQEKTWRAFDRCCARAASVM